MTKLLAPEPAPDDCGGKDVEEEHRETALEKIKSIEPVADSHLYGVTSLILGGVKVSITQGSKGVIKADRSDTTEHKREI